MPKYKVKEEEVQVLRITVIEGRGISVGKFSDAVDTPDPYVKLRVLASPNALQRTKTIPDEKNPKWNKEFKFFLDPDSKRERKFDIIVMDDDFGFDDHVGTETYDFSQLKVGETVYHTFRFKKNTFVDVKILLQIDDSRQLRYSYDLCDEENDFLNERTTKTLEGMKKLLKEEGPRNKDEVPVVGVMGSGGGFRALCGLSGVFAALEETGVLDCTTYVSGLSGSSWYISTLYSNSCWPEDSCEEIAKDIKSRVHKNYYQLFNPMNLLKYYRKINTKKCLGYPVSLTDFFGCLIGEILLQNSEIKLTHVRNKVNQAEVPLPLCTAIHVEKDVSAQAFSEWVEFSPYEVGLYKYGVFLKTEHFGGKFYKGRLVRNNKEQPLHYLQGIWGSAYTILFQRLVHENEGTESHDGPKDDGPKDDGPKDDGPKDDGPKDDGPKDDGPKDDGREELKQFVASDEIKHINEDSESDDEVETDDEEDDNEDDEENDEADDEEDGKPIIATKNDNPGLCCRIARTLISPFVPIYRACAEEEEEKRKPISHKTKEKDEPFWKSWIDAIINSSSTLRTREGRAAEIHNIFRGLEMESEEANDHRRIISNKVKNSFMVDGGLDFNSPYPLLLRPERNVNLILSFDFSQRDSDNTSPFVELLLAERWAREENLPFPPVANDPRIKDPDIKELYVFQDENDVKCPIVMHFVLINKTFKDYKKPGLPRETKEEKEFGNFTIFNDKDEPYSTFKFDYTDQEYERLYYLMKFNTLLNLDIIKEKMIDCIQRRRNNTTI